MQLLNHSSLKQGFTTHAVGLQEIFGTMPFESRPRVSDLVVAEVLAIGQHDKIENRDGAIMNLFVGDQIVGAFGNRYATDQFEGYVPQEIVDECDMLSIGGVFGNVTSKHNVMKTPTRLRLVGAVCNRAGIPLSLINFGIKSLPTNGSGHRPEVILVIGASMNSGKTTVAGMLSRALSRAGFRVAAAKTTGTAAGKDGRFIASCGANPVVDFTDAGYPATYMLSLDVLLDIQNRLLGHLRATKPDYIVVEVADGIYQRETEMLLESEEFRRTFDHVFFAANDSLSAECGVRCVRSHNLPLRATAGVMSQSALSIREAERATNVPCLSSEMIVSGKALDLLSAKPSVPAFERRPVSQLTYQAA